MSELSFDTNEAKIAYGIGRQIGDQLKGGDLGELSLPHLYAAIEDALNGAAMRVPGAELEAAFAKLQEEMEAKSKESAKEVVAAGEAFLAENKAAEGIQVTDSGLQYLVLEEGNGATPTAQSTVKVHYEGRLTDGQVFDSSIARGEPIEFPLGGVIAGWTEGLQLMKEGAKYRFTIPAELAYGAQGAGAMIKPHSVLVFDVELLEVK
ncbi:FKBP-type peptidyl-prolyl cis-trans isomerase [Marinomonas mediterranea]|jgi:FKBP-type peptidyl-prolyl cis-trans isomerases 1|uniref:Peptidyl-prolyl cis-trans isomerase n=1 Tax=Marinomonas mediterranea (strain ATCC 700492 / JCM 21426 / NBRC 103028 / MMB-1) TaxID=717774 RepID=F2JWD2_MARM1|nr:FKBP-type peptidyl-prolyl cis-trans isomerase [Marinomonas mediterranea]ADZ90605.1 peptidylprolyl isomerase FKBP-type [Marinomonas mediterranea MMB-1]WCN16775.1 FKBP-type peptidyl-prolyl cis-trans isomerase [Marinomonas mediterranea MMB-1]